jgi:hypothetical protein
MPHNIALHDVVTFTLIKKSEEDYEDEEGSDDDEDEEGSEKDVQEEMPLDRAEYVFTMKAHAMNGDIKNFIIFLVCVRFTIKYMY